jgi:hypothetical protein
MNGHVITIELKFGTTNEWRMQVIDLDRGNRVEGTQDFKSKSKAVETARLYGKILNYPIRLKSGNNLSVLR